MVIHGQVRCGLWVERLRTLHVKSIAKVSSESLVAWPLDLRGLRSLFLESLVLPAALGLLATGSSKVGGMTGKPSSGCPILLT